MIPLSPSKKSSGEQEPRSGKRCITLFESDDRGQTFFDFVTGITLFLLVLIFTVFFIPGLVDPFEPSPDASTVLADRGADHLTQNVMRVSGSGPYVLEQECTVALFDGSATTACDVSSDELSEIVGMGSESNAYAEIVDDDGNPVVIDGVTLQQGNDLDAASVDVYSATRIVTIDGDRYEFRYTVW